MQANAARKDDPLQIAPFPNDVFDRISVANTNDVLFDDGAVIQLIRDIVTGSANQFDASPIGLMVRLGSDKRGQKGMVNINDAVAIVGCKLRGQNLHISGQHDQVNPLARQKLQLFPFLFSLVLQTDGEDMEGNAEPLSNRLKVTMVAADQGNGSRELSRGIPQ